MTAYSLRHSATGALLWAVATLVHANCSQWPVGMTFVGLTEQGWRTYAVPHGSNEPRIIDLKAEARTPVMTSRQDAIAYLDEAGGVRIASLDGQRRDAGLEPPREFAYAQPEWDRENGALYLVQLKEGQSVDTDIVRFEPESQSLTPVVTQRSAQFEPYLAGLWLYYSHVHCVLGCGQIIQEIWRYHTGSGVAEQITLNNAISRQPAVDDTGAWLYFSSNAAGHFHIYRQSLKTGATVTAEPLTEGAVTDLSPAPVDDRLYFVRQRSGGSTLMCRNEAGQLTALDTPMGVTNIRDLEVRYP